MGDMHADEENKPQKTWIRGLLTSDYTRNLVAFWILGLINNLAYVVVNSAAQSLVEGFHKQKLIGLILWCNIAFGLVARIFNTFLLEGLRDLFRVCISSVIMIIGLTGVALSVAYNQWFLCLLSIVFVGSSSSFGESVLLAHMRRYAPEVISGWSSGTGMAGVGGSLIYVLFVAVGLSNEQSFLILVPSGVIYCIVFVWMLVPPASIPVSTNTIDPSELEKASLIANDANQTSYTEGPATPRSRITETKTQRYVRCFKLVWWPAVNLLLVYFFEYVASVGGSDKAQPDDSKTSPNWFVREAYVVLAFCYQLGVLISRSSLSLIKIRRIGVITVLQGINMIFWVIQAKYKFITGPVGVWFLFIIMVYVGLLGGASYVNVFYLILHDNNIADIDRELCVNITAILVTIGITLSSVFILIMDNTFLSSS